MKKRYLPLVLFLLVAGAFFVQLLHNASGEDPRALESALVGKPMPDSNLKGLWGESLSYEALFKQGQPVLVNVWATWCPTCAAEHEFLKQLAEKNIPIIGVDYRDGIKEAKLWLLENGNPYITVIDDSNGELGLDLGIYGAPETFVVDGNGIIRYRFTGNLDEAAWQEFVKPVYDDYVKKGQ